ncbi:MAG: hypothetical protein AAFV95_01290 [Bacteroidota bacterium]
MSRWLEGKHPLAKGENQNQYKPQYISRILKLVDEPEDELSSLAIFLFRKLGFEESTDAEREVGTIRQHNGEVIITMDNGAKSIKLADCKRVTIRYEGYRGEIIFSHRQRPLWHISSGHRNQIAVETDEQLLEFHFFLQNKKDKNFLKEILCYCYDNAIQLKEYYRGVRTFQWRRVDYKEIQEIKRQYKLTEW